MKFSNAKQVKKIATQRKKNQRAQRSLAKKQMRANYTLNKYDAKTRRIEAKTKARNIRAFGESIATATAPTASAIAGTSVTSSVVNSNNNKEIASLINPSKIAGTSNEEEEESKGGYVIR